MTGNRIEVELHSEEARQALRQLFDRLERRAPFFKSVGDQQVNSTKNNFARETAPDGAAWQALRPATIRARQKRKLSQISILRETGSLAGSINSRASEDGVEVGSAHPLSPVHQLGKVIDKKEGARWMVGRRFAKRDNPEDGHEVAIRAHKITIPARPFIGVSAEDEQRIAEIAEDWLMRG